MKKILLLSIALLLTMGAFLVICSAQDYTQWQLPEGTKTRLGKGRINDIVFSPDGTQFTVATSIGIWIYSTDSGKELSLLTGHEVEVMSAVFSPDGRTLISVDSNGESRRWNAATGEQLSILTEGNDIVKKVVLSADGTRLFTVNLDDRFRVWDLNDLNSEPILVDDTEQSVNDIEISRDAQIIAATKIPHYSGSDRPVENFRLQVWNTMTQRMLFKLYGEEPHINTLKFSSDGKTLVTAENNGEIKFWNVDTGANWLTIKKNKKVIRTLVFIPHKKLLATADIDNTIRFWDIASDEGQPSQSQVFKELKENISTMIFSPDEKTLLTSTQNGTIQGWDIETGSQRFKITGHVGEILHLAISENGKILTTANFLASRWLTDDTYLQHWDISTNGMLSTDFLEFEGVETITPDCRNVIIKDKDGKFEMLDIETKNTLFTITEIEKDALSGKFVFSLDGKTAAARGKDYVVHLWQIANASQISKPWKTLKGHTKWIKAMAFSPDGKMLASGENKTVHLWNLETGEILFSFAPQLNSLEDIAFSPDGKTLAGGSREAIYLWDTVTGKEIGVCIPERITTSMTLVFSPDSKTLVSACGARVLKFADHEVMLPSGGWVTATASTDDGGIFQLWDSRTGELLSTHTGHTNRIIAFAFSKDSKTFATGSRDGTVLLWDWEKISQVGSK
ncbi:MAG: WD40 repeat domain-containing protein [Candidatus Poribacteria bacterium]|nr:WD40 repeat domain-containing protein [Candidatus Poribacteria bacterium]